MQALHSIQQCSPSFWHGTVLLRHSAPRLIMAKATLQRRGCLWLRQVLHSHGGSSYTGPVPWCRHSLARASLAFVLAFLTNRIPIAHHGKFTTCHELRDSEARRVQDGMPGLLPCRAVGLTCANPCYSGFSLLSVVQRGKRDFRSKCPASDRRLCRTPTNATLRFGNADFDERSVPHSQLGTSNIKGLAVLGSFFCFKL